MTTSAHDTRTSSHRWSFVLAACWGVLGASVLFSGGTWLGLAQLALAASFLATALFPGIAAWDRAVPLGRK